MAPDGIGREYPKCTCFAPAEFVIRECGRCKQLELELTEAREHLGDWNVRYAAARQQLAEARAALSEQCTETLRLRVQLAEARAAVAVPVHIIFDGPPGPGPESGRFVEVETPSGKSIRLGTWINRGDGYWALCFNTTDYEAAEAGGE